MNRVAVEMVDNMASTPYEDSILQAKKIYKEYVSFPAIVDAYLSSESQPEELPEIFNVNAVWRQNNLARQAEDRFKTSSLIKIVDTNIIPLESSTFPMLTQSLLECPSPSGKFQAIIIPSTDTVGDSKGHILQIYSKQACIQSFYLAKSHGPVSVGNIFSGMCWSTEEDKIIYAAEKKRAKSRSFFSENSSECDVTPGREYEYYEHWGEQMQDCFSPEIFVLNRVREEVRVFGNLPEGYSFGHPILTDKNSIVCIGVMNEPFRLGLFGCFNRTGYLFHIAIDESFCDRLGEKGRLAFEPRYCPEKDLLVYLDHPLQGPNMAECRVMMINWRTKQLNIVVESPSSTSSGIRGLFCYSLPRNCFSTDGSHMFLSSYNNTSLDIYSVDLLTRRITPITNEPGTWKLLDVCQDLLLASVSTPSKPPQLLVCLFYEGFINKWVRITNHNGTNRFEQLKWEVRQFSVSDTSEPIDAILVHPFDFPKEKKPPLFVFLHGGPNIPCTAQFIFWTSCLPLLGFMCLVPNFRGTLGYSRSSIRSLIGKLGRQDVDDVHRTVEHVLSEGLCDPERVVCYGGSHGGFLAAHLLGQFPKVYKAAAVRNPVFNLASIVGVTDIPDWCYLVCGYEYSHDSILSAEVLDSMLSKSPNVYAKDVQGSLLIFLGERDCRVPNSQGLAYFRLLKSLGKDIKILSYPKSCHSLNEANIETDMFVNGISFILESISL